MGERKPHQGDGIRQTRKGSKGKGKRGNKKEWDIKEGIMSSEERNRYTREIPFIRIDTR